MLCHEVENGLIESEVTVTIRGYDGKREEYVCGAKDSLISRDGAQHLSSGVIRQDAETKAWLIQFPTEADSGAYRMWVLCESVLAFARSQTAVLA